MNLPSRFHTGTKCILLVVVTFFIGRVWALPPHGDPNQPYDRLPGKWKTSHVEWAKPLPGGALKVLFLVPYSNSREVVELAQRLDVQYTVIMNAGRSVWGKGYSTGDTASPLHGKEANALDRLAEKRLNFSKHYDVIVIGKVSWEVIPDAFRKKILDHVSRGTGLVYVSPNRFKEGRGSFEEVADDDPKYNGLFKTDKNPEVGKRIIKGLPFDFIPLKVLQSSDEFAKLRTDIPIYREGGRIQAQMPVCITTSQHGRGRVLALNFFDNKLSRQDADDSLTPRLEYDKVVYDYLYALLGRCVRWSARRDVPVDLKITFNGPDTKLTEPVDAEQMRFCYEFKTPQRVFARKDLPQTKIRFSVSGARKMIDEVTLNYDIRDSSGQTVSEGKTAGTQAAISVPTLPRGNFLVGLRVLNSKGQVLDFASRAFRVEDAMRVVKVVTDRDHYARVDTISGEVRFSAPLSDKQRAEIRVVDTWGRVVFKTPLQLKNSKDGGKFSVPVANPVSNLWDIYGVIIDDEGVIDSDKVWVGIPQKEFDEYYWGLIFCPSPGPSWKGCLYANRIRPFGINGNFSNLIYGNHYELEAVERYNLRNLMFAEHMGQNGNPKASRGPWDVELSESCFSEVSRMLRYTADTGQLMDSKKFPYKHNQGPWNLTADWLRNRIDKNYKKAIKFGTPFYTLTGENYLSGEMPGVDSPNSCFCKLCEGRFRDWCRKEYRDDLKVLNAEWGTHFRQWTEVRGILRKEAVEKGQEPRWVAFRHFIRSRMWTQLFIDWTDALRRVAPDAKTGRVGHDHFDFSRFRNHMTSSKIYNMQQHNDELHGMMSQELLQSFSADNSWLIGACSNLRWMPDFRTPRRNHRLPWKMLFMGFRGFDWENFLPNEILGGMSCFTPDLSEPMPYFKNISDQVLYLQRGVGKLANTAKPHRSPVAILWSPVNDYVSRLNRPGGKNINARTTEKHPFSGTWLYNVSYSDGAHHDCLALLKSIRIRGTFVAPEDAINGDLEKRGFKALILPYSKAMSVEEAEAIRRFVKNGGLVIADNTPGIYSRFGRPLDQSRLADLFPVTNKPHVIRIGKGHAAYAPEQICGYLKRMARGDRAGSDEVAALLKNYSGITTPIELIDNKKRPRRDTLMPIYLQGSAMYVGMMRHEESDGNTEAPTTLHLGQKYHLWDVREKKYIGHTRTAKINLDMYPKFFALLPAQPVSMKMTSSKMQVFPGEILRVTGTVRFAEEATEKFADMGQAAHIRVYTPGGREVECFRKNIIFNGDHFEFELPVSYSEAAGVYRVKAEHSTTGIEAQMIFEIRSESGR